MRYFAWLRERVGAAEETVETAAWLSEVKDILRERFAAPPAMKEIASQVGVHPVSLARAFRRRLVT